MGYDFPAPFVGRKGRERSERGMRVVWRCGTTWQRRGGSRTAPCSASQFIIPHHGDHSSNFPSAPLDSRLRGNDERRWRGMTREGGAGMTQEGGCGSDVGVVEYRIVEVLEGF